MGENGLILGCGLGMIVTIALFNFFGVATTKYASAPQRSTVDTSRTVLIWIFFLSFDIKGAEESFHWLELIGFVFLVIGTLVYNEIVIVPFMGFDEWTSIAIEKRQGSKGNVLRSNASNYIGTSPHAGYDNNRNQRNITNGMEKGLIAGKDDEYDLS